MPFSKANRMRALTAGVLALGVLSVQVGHGTLAYFTTQATSTGNAFSAGDLHFNINDNTDGTAGHTTVASSLTLSNMKPGDSVYAPITITNVGSLDGQYGISYTAANPGGTGVNLTPALRVAVVGAGSVTSTATTDCASTNFTSTALWAEQFLPSTGMLASATIADSTSSSHPTVAGSFDHSADATKSVPIVHATGVDVLCVEISYPYGTAPGTLTTDDNIYNTGDANTTVVFTFNGQQLNHGVEFDEQGTVPNPATPSGNF
jgi:predicted ribosomally synthesized peptide with SipW-like signal peptide